MDRFLVGSEYASHLTDADLGLLASVAAEDTGPRSASVRWLAYSLPTRNRSMTPR